MAGDFSDDEWDISDDQLQVLEHNAILSTQQQNTRNGTTSKNNTARSANSGSGSTVRLETPLPPKVIAPGLADPPPQIVQQRNDDSFENPVLDEDGVPLVLEEQNDQTYQRAAKVDETTQREQWRKNRFAQKNGHPAYHPAAKTIPHQAYQSYQQQNPQYGRPIQQQQTVPAPTTPLGTQFTPPSQNAFQQPLRPSGPAFANADLMRERMEREALQQKLDSLTAELHTARGENAVVRNKNASDSKLAERQLTAAKRQMQELATKHQAELQSRDAAYNQLNTDHRMMKHDLDEQTRRTNALQRQVKENTKQDRSKEMMPSPRKNLHNALRDGFDDDEILQLSPARSPAKRKPLKPTTPSKKRKHPVNGVEEPSLTLRFSQPQDQPPEPPKDEPAKPVSAPRFIKDHQTEQHLKLLQAVLNFRPLDSQETLVESLVTFAFPNDPNHSLSSLLLVETSKLRGQRFQGDLLDIFTKLLTRCAKDEYYKPLDLLLAGVDLILDLDPTIVDADVILTLVRPLVTLARINPSKRYFLDKNKVWDDKKHKPKLDPDVNTTKCLDLLFTIASLVLDEPGLIREFWRCTDTDLVLLMLTPFQQIADLHLTLELLSTSILPATFGNICTPEQQSTMETYIIDKICFLLHDPPRRYFKFRPLTPLPSTLETKNGQPGTSLKDCETPAEQSPSRIEICNLRLQVLILLSSLLTSFKSRSDARANGAPTAHHGTSIILSHPSAIARLVRCLYDEVSLLSSNLPTHALHARLINTITALLHHILLSPLATDPKGSFVLQRALAGTKVGAHIFRVVMTRIAFREEKAAGESQDSGISEESMMKATEVLEEYVTPDEAVQLVEVLGRPEGEEAEEARLEQTEAADVMDEDGDEEAERAEADVMAGIEQ